jgi:hypothetical protein
VKRTTIGYEFVEFVPNDLEEGVLYISLPYATAIHLCACGCGIKVVTPISPPEWQLRWDGDTVSLHPSIGNWQYPCRSHYWIRRNRIEWARLMTEREIAAGRRRDAGELEEYYSNRSGGNRDLESAPVVEDRPSLITRLRRRLSRR